MPILVLLCLPTVIPVTILQGGANGLEPSRNSFLFIIFIRYLNFCIYLKSNTFSYKNSINFILNPPENKSWVRP